MAGMTIMPDHLVAPEAILDSAQVWPPVEIPEKSGDTFQDLRDAIDCVVSCFAELTTFLRYAETELLSDRLVSRKDLQSVFDPFEDRP